MVLVEMARKKGNVRARAIQLIRSRYRPIEKTLEWMRSKTTKTPIVILVGKRDFVTPPCSSDELLPWSTRMVLDREDHFSFGLFVQMWDLLNGTSDLERQRETGEPSLFVEKIGEQGRV